MCTPSFKVYQADAKGGPEWFGVVGKITGAHVKVGRYGRVLVHFSSFPFVAQSWCCSSERSVLVQENLGCTC